MLSVDGAPPEIDAIWSKGAEWLRAQGAEVVEVSLPHTRYALPTYYIIAPAEASSNLARYDGVRYGLRVPGRSIGDMYENTRAAGFGAEVRRRVLIGTYVLSAGYYDAYYLKAQRVRTRIKWDFDEAFKSCDVILAPTAPSTAFAIGDKMDDASRLAASSSAKIRCARGRNALPAMNVGMTALAMTAMPAQKRLSLNLRRSCFLRCPLHCSP